MKIKLFYSYSHEDEKLKESLETHLAALRNDGLIDEWHDRKINAGNNLNKEIEKNIDGSHIILFLLSPDFIASDACQEEARRALKLEKEKGTILIPIILRPCSWKSLDSISDRLALPKDAKPITKWSNQDEAWISVCEGIKAQVESLRDKATPILNGNFKNELLKTSDPSSTLEKLFVYPNISEAYKSKKELENNEIDSSKLCDIENFQHSYILIEGEEQSGKTSLCNMLYINYIGKGFCPILINGKSIAGRGNIKTIVDRAYKDQYDSNQRYLGLDKTKRILIIDDINDIHLNNKNYVSFVESINANFKYAVVFVDALHKLTGRTTAHDYFSRFNDYSINSFGHEKRDELIKKCIANDQDSEFDINNDEQSARLDKSTNYINTITRSNIIPSYPIIVISSFNIIESAKTPQDIKATSYGYCYQAMITTQLYRSNIKPESINEYFNFLTELAYFMLKKETKELSEQNLNEFLRIYNENYISHVDVIDNLTKAHILVTKNNMYSFQYIYIYYYFAAKYIAANFSLKEVKQQFDKIIEKTHKKDDSNIVIFVTHHADSDDLLARIIHSSLSIFDRLAPVTLERDEIESLNELIKKVAELSAPPNDHDVEQHRRKQLEVRDMLQPDIDESEEDIENSESSLDSVSIEILKSARNIEIIGQILKNQYGTLRRNKLEKLFEEGQNLGLRVLRIFTDFIDLNPDAVKKFIEEELSREQEKNNHNLPIEEIQRISQMLANQLLYSIVFGWLRKLAVSLGYHRLTTIADKVNDKTGTAASRLINFSIHAWYKKDLDTDKLKLLYEGFDKENNHIAQHILRDIVSRHLYMHKVEYKEKSKINKILGFSISNQVSAQRKLEKK